MYETVSAGHAARGRRRIPGLLQWCLVFAIAVFAREGAAAVPVTVGLGIGTDVPGATIASGMTIDRGDPLGLALTVPILVGMLRIEPQFAITDQARSYDTPPPGVYECPGLMLCESFWGEGRRIVAGLALGPAWSVGERGRLWLGPWGGLTSRWKGSSAWQDWSLGMTVGGEYFLDNRFAFGLDVRATYTSVEDGGTYTSTNESDPYTRRVSIDYERGWVLGVDALAAFRIYLN